MDFTLLLFYYFHSYIGFIELLSQDRKVLIIGIPVLLLIWQGHYDYYLFGNLDQRKILLLKKYLS